MKQRKRTFDGSDRRQWRRLTPQDVPSLKGVSINQGTEACVIDISKGGMLLHTVFRLRPDMKILLKIMTTKGVFKVSGIVLRSSIKSISGAPLYESAITFESPLTVLDDLAVKTAPAAEPRPIPAPDIVNDFGDPKPSPPPGEISEREDPAVLTVLAPGGLGADLDRMLQMNDW
ncbi:MAG: hypothetical protein GXY47_08595 [Acidobacteria bacterium]|nr:hypothetical protein [Acidobacteriota bacterium]